MRTEDVFQPGSKPASAPDFSPGFSPGAELARYERIVDNAPGMLYQFVLRADGTRFFSYVSEGSREMYGLEPQAILNDATLPFALVHPDDILGLEESIALSAREMKPWSWEGRWLDERLGEELGRVRWLKGASRPTRGEDGGVVWDGLLLDVTEMKRAEAEMRHKSQFEALIASLSTSFINLPSDRLDEGINRALGEIGRFEAVDRAYVFLWQSDASTMSNTHEWCAPGVSAQIERLQDLPCAAFAWLCPKLFAREVVHIPRVDDLPPEAHCEREELKIEEIQSIVLVPMVYQDRFIGHLGFDAVREEKSWSESSISLLKIAGEMLVSALERKRAEDELRQSARELEAAIASRDRITDHSLDVICIIDRTGRFVQVSAASQRVWGLAPEEMRGLAWRQIVHPDDLEKTAESGRAVAAGEPARNFENRYFRRDGSIVFLSWSASYSPQHDVIFCVARDISEHKRAEEERRAGEARTRALLHAIPDLILHLRRDGTIIDLRPAKSFEPLIPAHEARGQTLRGLFPPALVGQALEIIERVLASGQGETLEYQLKNSPGPKELDYSDIESLDNSNAEKIEVQFFEARIAASGEDEVMAIVRDVSDARRAEQEILRLNQSLEQRVSERTAQLALARRVAESANNAKSEFLSRMSHELRTPLNAILGFGQLLEMRAVGPRDKQNIAQILKAGRHLLALINEVLDIARIETGQLSVSIEPVPVGDLMQEALSLIAPLAAQRNIELGIGPDSNRSCFVHADRQRLIQVLLNLLSNAVKYNHERGHVSLECRAPQVLPQVLGEVLGEGQTVHILVRDTGPGLSPDKVARLFQPFERLGAENTSVEGTGLGLALSKHLVEAMGGTLRVESEVGQGCTFHVELPAAISPSARLQAKAQALFLEPSSTSTRATILAIEDNPANIELLRQVLEVHAGLAVEFARDGKTGLEMARASRPDLILLDLHLPDIHGSQILRELVGSQATRAIPIIVLSADATPSQIERLRQDGARDYLTKPLDLPRFLRAVEDALADSAPRT